VVFGKSLSKNRDEEEVRGYRDALKPVHEQGMNIPISEETILKLHRTIRGDIWDAGKYKEKDGDIIEKYPDGRERVRFKTVVASKTPEAIGQLIGLWKDCLHEKWIHPLIALSAFNLDFLCIHPFRDGNGRVFRLLILLQCYQLDYGVGRYISIERFIEQNKERYYETLEQSSQGWHEGKHDPWAYINYLFYVLKAAYKEFEERVGQVKSPRGAKTALIEVAIEGFADEFTLNDLEQACPGVSRDMVRRVLRDLQNAGKIECLGHGLGAHWRRKDITLKKG